MKRKFLAVFVISVGLINSVNAKAPEAKAKAKAKEADLKIKDIQPTVSQSACNGMKKLTGSEISATLSGNTVCVGNSGGWEAQEQHYSNGELWDFKQGLNSKADPTSQVGTWQIIGDQVRYGYGGGAIYDNDFYQKNNKNEICFFNGEREIQAIVKSGLVGCD